MPVLPGKRTFEHDNLIGSALPLADQPGSRLQLSAKSFPDLPALFKLLCELAQPPLRLQAQPAESELLHSICDGSHQQLAAEVGRRLRPEETTPLLTKLADVELGEARKRLLADRVLPGRHRRHRSRLSTGTSR